MKFAKVKKNTFSLVGSSNFITQIFLNCPEIDFQNVSGQVDICGSLHVVNHNEYAVKMSRLTHKMYKI